jgi:hypothetical protein
MAFMCGGEKNRPLTALYPSANNAKLFLNTTYACACYFMRTVYMHHCVCSDLLVRLQMLTRANAIVNPAAAAGIA